VTSFDRFMDDLDDAAPADARAAGGPERLDGLPHGFVFKPKEPPPGRCRVEDDDDGGDKELVWLCTPIRARALLRGRGGAGWGRRVEVADRDGRPRVRAVASDPPGWTDDDAAAFAPGDRSVIGAANVVRRHERAPAAAAARCSGAPLAVASASPAFAGPLPETLETLETLETDGGGKTRADRGSRA